MKTEALLSEARAAFHRELLAGELTRDANGVPSIADGGSAVSRAVAISLVEQIGNTVTQAKGAGQTAGARFEQACANFIRTAFKCLEHLRPGLWEVTDSKRRNDLKISNFEQYEHLATLAELAAKYPEVAAVFDREYIITPDVVVFRKPEPDERINQGHIVVNESVARLTPLREANQARLLLHGSISCKWTLRSDRGQNARAEALNLIRNRKGRVPHIAAVTAEPLPSRIQSLALGTSDLDCVYHIALPELQHAVSQVCRSKQDTQTEILHTLVTGKRLRDIADLPLDLII